ncbi:FAD-dependent oxidoreductase [Paenibacillus cremeus]|uniref:FAD-dependent oxidoreductase n=1 Tax=Paenibacillus cremeus TaxID=2163881 RepID=UPI001648F156|nr:hypothetical protein [Paenibacillus cremeus]
MLCCSATLELCKEQTNEQWLENKAYGRRSTSERCDLLQNALQPGTIRYGYKLTEAVALECGQHALHFENGEQETVDLVIGADGAFSKLRPLISRLMR